MSALRLLRYSVDNKDPVLMPVSSKVVDAVYQITRGSFSIYAVVPTDERQVVERHFRVLATGDNIPENAKYIRAIIMRDGFHVFHVIELQIDSQSKGEQNENEN